MILINDNSITQGTSSLILAQGARYDYAVLCTDYCGSKTWDVTNLEADLYFVISRINEINDEISIYTRYNSTPLIEKPNDPDYGIFTLNESYMYSSRESKSEKGKFAWQWSTLEAEFSITIPHFFIAYAHPVFENNSFLIQQISESEEIEISSQNIFQAIIYQGEWSYDYNISDLSVTDEAILTSTYDSNTGILLQMELEKISIQVPPGPLSQDINIDALGSFKITMPIPSVQSTVIPTVILVLPLIILVFIEKKRF